MKETILMCLNWLKEQVYNVIVCCRDITEENIPLIVPRTQHRNKYYGNLTPPSEEERIDILIEEQPTIINIIDNTREEKDIYYEASESHVESV